MRTLTAAVLISASLALPALGNAALDNNTLYKWETKNGTPTYSPDPPPKGVDYVVVGADLQPLAQQPTPLTDAERSSPSNTISEAKTANAKTVQKAEPVKKWKPVRYANAPETSAQPIIKAKKTPETAAKPTVIADIATPIAFESEECLAIKREKLVFESQFTRAKTNAEMDSAILSLRDKSGEYRQKCQSN